MSDLKHYVSDSTPASDESWTTKLGREGQLVAQGLGGFGDAAADAWANPERTGLKATGAVVLGVGLGLLAQRTGFGALAGRAVGAGLAAGFIGDIAANGGAIAKAMGDSWDSDANFDANKSVMRKHVGTFAFDTALYSVAGLGSAKLTAMAKPSIELRRNFDVTKVTAADGVEYSFRFPKEGTVLRTSNTALLRALEENRTMFARMLESNKPAIESLALHGTTQANADGLLLTKNTRNPLFSSAARPELKPGMEAANSLEARSAIAFSYAWTSPNTNAFMHQKSGPAVMVMEHGPQHLVDRHPEKFAANSGSRYYSNEPKLWTGTGKEGQVEIGLTPRNFAEHYRGVISRAELDRFDPTLLRRAFSPESLSAKEYNRRWYAGEPLKIDRLQAFGSQYVSLRSLQILGHVWS